MKLLLLLTGKTTNAQLQTLIDDYVKRLAHYVPFSIQVLPDLKNAKTLSMEQVKEQEGQLILKALSPNQEVVLLDEHGREFRSIEFADYVQRKLSSGRDVVFVVGGPYGFSKAVYDRADGQLSISKMTFSHQMIRLLFTEQLYRAMTILHHEPYHHE
ncbi:MAG: 23S rRNA (pseudouridine(1915)-N(3))-methyltransferase RlmH [Paludibacteraceae bacterium]|nr:23S rRNA (pseudouridine(1915)-N(3))-methyltransferase RlmH [Paludibacteraceae bacterium]